MQPFLTCRQSEPGHCERKGYIWQEGPVGLTQVVLNALSFCSAGHLHVQRGGRVQAATPSTRSPAIEENVELLQYVISLVPPVLNASLSVRHVQCYGGCAYAQPCKKTIMYHVSVVDTRLRLKRCTHGCTRSPATRLMPLCKAPYLPCGLGGCGGFWAVGELHQRSLGRTRRHQAQASLPPSCIGQR